MRVVAFNGSPRKNGNTYIMLRHVFDELEARGIETTLVQLGGTPIKPCRACYKCFERQDRCCSQKDDGLNGYMEQMAAADGIIFGSPTYFCNVSGETKALIDRAGLVALANGALLRRKVGAAVVAVRRAGGIHVFDSINYFFTINQMIIPGSSYWNVGVGHDRGDVKQDEEGLGTMKTLGENMAWLLEKLYGGGE